MNRSAVAKIDRFTPLPDSLVEKFGLVTAAVYGRIWRYSQARRGVCDASQQKIADELGLDRVTVNQHIKKLVETGYLDDRTPTVTNRPHTYSVTNKLTIEMTVTVVENNTSGVVQNNSTVNLDNSTVVQNNTKIHIKKQDKKQESLFPTEPAIQEFFFQYHRKRWKSPAEEELFTQTLAVVGSEKMIAAIKWAAANNIAGVPRICTAARKWGTAKPVFSKVNREEHNPVLPEGILDG